MDQYDSTATFGAFKDAVLTLLYPTASRSYCFSYGTLQEIVTDQAQQHIASIKDYEAYYRRFFPVSKYLRSKPGLISLTEESRLFVSRKLGVAIKDHLERRSTSEPNQVPELDTIHDAAVDCLLNDYFAPWTLPFGRNSPILTPALPPS